MLCETMFEKIKDHSVFVFLILILTTGCNTGRSTPVGELVAPTIIVTARPTVNPIVNPTVMSPEQQADVVSTPTTFVWESAPSCTDGTINPIGQAIADDYDSVGYEQVMTWFCNGAEFDDIMVALETEAQTDATVDEMLKMLADGFTWDEIWQSVGLAD